MIVHTSALIAIRRDERDAATFTAAIEAASDRRRSAADFLEAAIVIDGSRNPIASRGSGHPARLNFGDCFAHALARSSGEKLLFEGGDFAQTDVAAAPP